MTYTDNELARLLGDLESDLVERKRTAADRSAIRRTITAFANDLAEHQAAGVIFIGVEDDGTCAHIAITDELMNTLAQMRGDGNILPLPSMLVQKRFISGCELVAIIVTPSNETPIRYQGRTFIKVGSTVQLASPEEERILAERRRAADLSFDMRPASGATFDELDLNYFSTQYLPRAVSPDVLELNQRSIEQQMESLRLTYRGNPTYGALLSLGRDPQRWLPGAYVQFLRLDGATITDPIRDQKTLTGRLEDVLRRMDELLEINISVRTDVTGNSVERQAPDYPIVALRQLARNAVMHRNYESTKSPVRISWFTDRVEIQSPGGLYGQVNPGNFGKGATDYRNPLVAEIMHHLGFAQRFGLGIPLVMEELRKNNNPAPQFDFQPTMVGVTVRAAL